VSTRSKIGANFESRLMVKDSAIAWIKLNDFCAIYAHGLADLTKSGHK
jgi:hypothetical protein